LKSGFFIRYKPLHKRYTVTKREEREEIICSASEDFMGIA